MLRIPLLLAVLLAGPVASTPATELYATDFDDFATGNNAWGSSTGTATDGWRTNDTTSGAQAIDEGLFNGALGKTAALGFNLPNNVLTTVLRSINYDPVSGGNPLLEFQTLFGIEDSTEFTNLRRDDFFFSFYNTQGNLLASIRISNQESLFGFWRRDGLPSAGGTDHDTGQDFIRGELHNLNARIHLGSNRWTVFLDGIPLFENAPFNATGVPLNLGPIAAEWRIAAGNRFAWGDNWMLLADLSVETVESALTEPEIDSIACQPSGSVTLTWRAGPGFDDKVEYSSDLANWLSDLPDSTKAAPLHDTTFTYTDGAAPKTIPRFYRVVRTPVAP